MSAMHTFWLSDIETPDAYARVLREAGIYLTEGAENGKPFIEGDVEGDCRPYTGNLEERVSSANTALVTLQNLFYGAGLDVEDIDLFVYEGDGQYDGDED